MEHGHLEVETRDPAVINRDPVVKERERVVGKRKTKKKREHKPRRYMPAEMPTVCPFCGHNTRIDGGKYNDPVNRNVVEYRSCIKCGELLTASRPMTKSEIEKHCTHSSAVEDYQISMRNRKAD